MVHITCCCILLCAVSVSAAPGARAGKGGKGGDGTICNDGRQPRPTQQVDSLDSDRKLQGQRGENRDGGADDMCDDGLPMKMILACVGGSCALLLSVCTCVYCWRRAAMLHKRFSQVQSIDEETTVSKAVGMQGTVVVGHPVHEIVPGNGNVASRVEFAPTDKATGAEAV